jgi:hypothetical protein
MDPTFLRAFDTQPTEAVDSRAAVAFTEPEEFQSRKRRQTQTPSKVTGVVSQTRVAQKARDEGQIDRCEEQGKTVEWGWKLFRGHCSKVRVVCLSFALSDCLNQNNQASCQSLLDEGSAVVSI